MGLVVLAAIIAELASITIGASYLGWLWTLAALAAAGVLGTSVLGGRGVTTLARASQALNQGEAVGLVVADGALVALAGVLLVIPGFVSDAVALLLLVPWLRRVAARRLLARFRDRVVMVGDPRGLGDLNGSPGGEVIDTTATEVEPPVVRRPELP